MSYTFENLQMTSSTVEMYNLKFSELEVLLNCQNKNYRFVFPVEPRLEQTESKILVGSNEMQSLQAGIRLEMCTGSA